MIYPSVKWHYRWAIRQCSDTTWWAILLFSDTTDDLSVHVVTADDLSFCEVTLQMSYPSVYSDTTWWAILLCSDTTDELSFFVVILQMSCTSVYWHYRWAILLCRETTDELSFCVVTLLYSVQMRYPSVYWKCRWAILSCSKTADEVSFCLVKLQMSTFCFFVFLRPRKISTLVHFVFIN